MKKRWSDGFKDYYEDYKPNFKRITFNRRNSWHRVLLTSVLLFGKGAVERVVHHLRRDHYFALHDVIELKHCIYCKKLEELYMGGTTEGGKMAAETTKKKYGKDFHKKVGAKGGRASRTGGFYANRELARLAGAKGGSISRRGHKAS